MKNVLLMVLMLAGTLVVRAQEAEDYSDEELTKYATVMAWAELEKGRMTGVYNEWINNDETLEAARFVKIKNAKGDSVKLAGITATDEELVAFEKILLSYDSMVNAFTIEYKAELKEKVGYGQYNKLKKSLKSDAAVKDRYKAIYDAILAEQKAAKEEETD